MPAELGAQLRSQRLGIRIAVLGLLQLELLRQRRRTAQALTSGRVVAGVDHQSVQPGGELRLTPVLPNPLTELEQRFLRGILSIAKIGELAPGDPANPFCVALTECIECPFVAVFRTLDQDGIAQPFVTDCRIGPEWATDSTAIGSLGFHG